MPKIQLKRYEVNTLVWDKIQEIYEPYLKYEENIYSKFYGYEDKHLIYFNDDYLIIQEYRFNYIYKELFNEDIIEKPAIWKQIILRLDDTVEKPTKLISGSLAYNYIMKLLKKDYTEDEIKDILHSHSAEYDPALKQVQIRYNNPLVNKIFRFKEVYKYDIHKAHASIIMQLFPKSKKRIINILNKATQLKKLGKLEEAKMYKNYCNLFVGDLCRKGYRKTYNYIVQSITKKLLETSDYANGQIIYANTDSFAVVNPSNLIKNSEEFGEFGLEYHGPAYFYRGSNYIIYKFGDDVKGSCRKKVRDLFNFEDGTVVKYTSNRIFLCEDEHHKKHYRTEIENICTEKVNVVEL